MRKEKFSYVILIAEIAVIVWLHSVKATENKEVAAGNIVENQVREKKVSPPANSPLVKYIQAVQR